MNNKSTRNKTNTQALRNSQRRAPQRRQAKIKTPRRISQPRQRRDERTEAVALRLPNSLTDNHKRHETSYQKLEDRAFLGTMGTGTGNRFVVPSGDNSFTAYDLVLNPANPELFPRASQLASIYEFYRFSKLRIEVVSASSYEAVGRLVLAFDLDPVDTPPTSYAELTYYDSSESGSYKDSFHCECKDVALKNWKYVSARPIEGQDRWTSYAQLILGCSHTPSSNKVDCAVYLSYHVEFKVAVPPPTLSGGSSILRKIQTVTGIWSSLPTTGTSIGLSEWADEKWLEYTSGNETVTPNRTAQILCSGSYNPLSMSTNTGTQNPNSTTLDPNISIVHTSGLSLQTSDDSHLGGANVGVRFNRAGTYFLQFEITFDSKLLTGTGTIDELVKFALPATMPRLTEVTADNRALPIVFSGGENESTALLLESNASYDFDYVQPTVPGDYVVNLRGTLTISAKIPCTMALRSPLQVGYSSVAGIAVQDKIVDGYLRPVTYVLNIEQLSTFSGFTTFVKNAIWLGKIARLVWYYYKAGAPLRTPQTFESMALEYKKEVSWDPTPCNWSVATPDPEPEPLPDIEDLHTKLHGWTLAGGVPCPNRTRSCPPRQPQTKLL